MSRAGVRAAMYLDRWTIEIRVTHHTDTQTERELQRQSQLWPDCNGTLHQHRLIY